MAVGCWSLALHTAADEVLSRRTWQCQTLAGHQSVCLTRLELGEERGARPRYLSQPDRSGRATGNPRIHLQAVRSPAYSIWAYLYCYVIYPPDHEINVLAIFIILWIVLNSEYTVDRARSISHSKRTVFQSISHSRHIVIKAYRIHSRSHSKQIRPKEDNIQTVLYSKLVTTSIDMFQVGTEEVRTADTI